MQVNFEVRNKTLIVTFYGELDHHIAESIRKKIDNVYSEKRLSNIILDLKNLNFMDSAGIGLVMGRYKLVTQNSGKLYLVNVNLRVEKILNMSGVLKIAKVFKNIDEALENL